MNLRYRYQIFQKMREKSIYFDRLVGFFFKLFDSKLVTNLRCRSGLQ